MCVQSEQKLKSKCIRLKERSVFKGPKNVFLNKLLIISDVVLHEHTIFCHSFGYFTLEISEFLFPLSFPSCPVKNLYLQISLLNLTFS